MKVLDLFSGIGGFSLGLQEAGMETVAFCEIEPFCQKVLSKNFPNIPIFQNIKTLTKEKINEFTDRIDLVCGGFPCQPYSTAGKQKGRNDDRDLWPEMFRVIKETRPAWVIGENVANFVGMEFTRTKTDLESIGYRVLPFVIPACAVGAQHRRNRVWIIAHLNSAELREQSRRSGGPSREGSGKPRGDGQEESFADIDSNGFGREANASEKEDSKRNWESYRWTEASFNFGNWWEDKSNVGRIVHGLSTEMDGYRRDRIKSLGNSIVPQIAYIIGKQIISLGNNAKS